MHATLCEPRALRCLRGLAYWAALIGLCLFLTAWRGTLALAVLLAVMAAAAPVVAMIGMRRPRASRFSVVTATEHEGSPTPAAIPRAADRSLFWFGVDSATWVVMDPLLERGRLPHIQRLVDEGCRASLRTLVPTHSPILWTSLVTGKSPLKHGIRDFLTLSVCGLPDPIEVVGFDPVLSLAQRYGRKLRVLSRRPVASFDRKALALWNILSAAGRKVGVVSWFVTDPVEKIDGFMVPEFFYMLGRKKFEAASSVHPAELDQELRELAKETEAESCSPAGIAHTRERFRVRGKLSPSEEHKIEVLRVFYYSDVMRVRVAERLLQKCPAQAVFMYLHGTDAAQHHLWHCLEQPSSPFHEAIPAYYEYVDEVLGRMRGLIDESATVLLTSDHGHGPIKPHKRIYHLVFDREGLSGTHFHGPDGVFVAGGGGIRRGVRLPAVSLYDVAPTILRLFGLPVANDMDGRVLEEFLDPGLPDAGRIDTYEGRVSWRDHLGPATDLSENEAVLRRLRDLGYID